MTLWRALCLWIPIVFGVATLFPVAAAEPQRITVGSKTFTESVILGEILGKLVSQVQISS